MKSCVFAGTFDPLTNGHKFVINKCLDLFDSVVIAIGVNVDKEPAFTLDARKEMIKKAFGDNPKITIETFSGMLTSFMKENGILVNVRGIRDEQDYKYETTMERYNRDMYPEMTTLYIPTPKDLVQVSSSAIRNILALKGDIAPYVPKGVYEYIKELNK